MKKVIVLLVCILLCGCAEQADLNSELDAVFSSDEEYLKLRRNNYSEYIDYYMPSDTGEMDSDKIGTVFLYNSSTFIMDINIAGILNDRYYPGEEMKSEGFFDESKLVYERRGNYTDSDRASHEYVYKVYEHDGKYLSEFLTKELVFYGYGTKTDIVPLSSRILLMAKGATVRESNVITAFSSRNEIDYQKKEVNLFETVMPVNGNVNDFMIDKEENEDNVVE